MKSFADEHEAGAYVPPVKHRCVGFPSSYREVQNDKVNSMRIHSQLRIKRSFPVPVSNPQLTES